MYITGSVKGVLKEIFKKSKIIYLVTKRLQLVTKN